MSIKRILLANLKDVLKGAVVLAAVAIAFLLIVFIDRVRDAGDAVVLGDNGHVSILRKRWFSHDDLPLRWKDHEWWLAKPAGEEWFPSPYVGHWNGQRNVILEKSGRMFIVQEKPTLRLETKWIDGAWRIRSGDNDEWSALDDPDVPF